MPNGPGAPKWLDPRLNQGFIWMVNGGLQNVLVTCIYLAPFHCRVPKFLARGPLLPNLSLPEDVFGWSQICSNQSHCTAADRIMGAQAVLYLEGSCESVLCTNWLHNLFKFKIQLQHTPCASFRLVSTNRASTHRSTGGTVQKSHL